MARYIDADALMDKLCHGCTHESKDQRCLDCDDIQTIADFPGADVAPVVRCKDCQYWQDNNGGYPHPDCRWGHEETPDENDFCSYGERKDCDG